MKRSALALFGAALLLASIGWAITSQTEELEAPTGYVRSDLQLISQESKETWSSTWTGPIQAATIVAWFQEHGYSRLLRDLNGDEVIDELDTIELADIFGLGIMQADDPLGTTDAKLVIGLAEYVADLYPNEFILKIYDQGFPAEFAVESSAPFAMDAIPGIVMTLEGEPSLEAYEYELETAEGVIVGLEERENQNAYLSGRSYEYLESLLRLTPVDFAWSEENRLLPGHQGRVLETVAKTEDRFYVDYRFGWTPVEFMLALSPRELTAFTSMSYECPEDALAYHVTTNPTPNGTVRIEECVIREGDYDTYIWIVTNIDYEWLGCGICSFAVANGGLSSVAHTGPPPWTFSEFGWMWKWASPLGSCGITAGKTGVFSVTVPGPTADIWVPGAVQACVPSVGPGMFILDGAPLDAVRTTGPMPIEEGDCPDLTVLIRDNSCSYNRETDQWDITVLVRVVNVGSLPVTTPFGVLVESDTYPASMAWGPALPIAAGGYVDGTLEYSITSTTPPCYENFTVTVDFDGAVPECDEDNNVAYGSECCEGGPGDGIGACCLPNGICVDTTESECDSLGGLFEGIGTACATTECPSGCPDLTVEIIELDCRVTGVTGQPTGGVVGGTARITNIGSAPVTSSSVKVRISSDWGTWPSTWIGPLDPGEHEDVTFGWSFGRDGECDGEVTVEVDAPPEQVIECDEGNNEDSREI